MSEADRSACVSVSLSRFLNTGWRRDVAPGPSRPSQWVAPQQTAAQSVCLTLLVTCPTSHCRCVEALVRTQRSLKVIHDLCYQLLVFEEALTKTKLLQYSFSNTSSCVFLLYTKQKMKVILHMQKDNGCCFVLWS